LYYFILVTFLAIYGALNYYIGLRGWQLVANRASFLDIKVYWAVFALIVLSSIVGIAAKRILPDFLRSRLYLIGSYWLAAMAYFISFLVIFDLVRLLDRWC